MAQGTVHVAPGASYVVLARLGVEIDERGGAPTIVRILGEERDPRVALREGDVVRSVNGRVVRTRREALGAIAGARGAVRLVVERNGHTLARTMAF
jgi:hypothetical protein